MTYNEDDKKVYQTDLIYKSDVLETYAELYDIFDDNKNIQKEFDKVFDKLNDITAVEPKQGEWIDKGWYGDWQFETDGRGNCWHEYECSECGFHKKGNKSNYCPDCGVKMSK